MLAKPGNGKPYDQSARDLIPMIAEAASGIESLHAGSSIFKMKS